MFQTAAFGRLVLREFSFRMARQNEAARRRTLRVR